ncbi:MAG: hypothetical protein GEU81_06880 [Nitriliruptorales bacterium]|nr:hypothetical protein [Nitriliruptorales bacterium]
MLTGEDEDHLTPPQRRARRELLSLAGDQPLPRPPADEGVVDHVRRLLESRTAEVASARPPGARGLLLNKTKLNALDCDGRYLDLVETPFAWSPATVLGTLAHTAIGLDQAGGQRADVSDVVALAWRELPGKGGSAGDYLAGLGGVEADGLRADAAKLVIEFRDCFPPLDPRWTVRFEPSIAVSMHDRALTLLGKPDLLLGRAHPTERRQLLIDFKTGRPSPRDRVDMRFYALLATLKYGVAPFRVATYYLAEADWEAEDVDADTLEAAARGVAEKAAVAARLSWSRPPAHDLRLLPGPACNWCGRAPSCPAKAADDAASLLSHPEGALAAHS